jgi:hypothetical protein
MNDVIETLVFAAIVVAVAAWQTVLPALGLLWIAGVLK